MTSQRRMDIDYLEIDESYPNTLGQRIREVSS